MQVKHLVAVADRKMHGRQRRRVHVMQERLGYLPEPALHRRKQAGLPHQPADHVAAVVTALQRAAADEFTDQPMRGGQRNLRAARDLGQARFRCRSSNAPRTANNRDVTVAPGVDVLPAIWSILPLSESLALSRGCHSGTVTRHDHGEANRYQRRDRRDRR